MRSGWRKGGAVWGSRLCTYVGQIFYCFPAVSVISKGCEHKSKHCVSSSSSSNFHLLSFIQPLLLSPSIAPLPVPSLDRCLCLHPTFCSPLSRSASSPPSPPSPSLRAVSPAHVLPPSSFIPVLFLRTLFVPSLPCLTDQPISPSPTFPS